MAIICPVCCKRCKVMRDYVRHMLCAHRYDATYFAFCSVQGCRYQTKSYNAFKMHVKKRHKYGTIDECIMLGNDTVDTDSDDSLIDETESDTCLTLHEKAIAKFLLVLEIEHKVSKEGIDKIFTSTGDLLNDFIEFFKNKSIQNLQDDDLKDLFANTFANIDLPLPSLNSNNRRLLFYKENFNYIKPEQVLMGTTYIKTSKKPNTILKSHFGYIVPMQLQLQLLLSQTEIWHYYRNPVYSMDEMTRDICDSNAFKANPLYLQNKPFLQLILYFDDLEIQNPLRSNQIHKVSMFYWQIANIPQCYRSKLKTIFLLATCRSKLVSKFGIHNLLKNFVHTVNKLKTDGIRMTINGKEETIYGDLLFAMCDHLAGSQLGGFKASSAFAYKACRACFASADSMKESFDLDKYQPRTLALYKQHCSLIEGCTNPNVRQNYSMMYGINNRSPLDDIYGFDVTQDILVDAMHCVLEGCLANNLGLFLKECLRQKLFKIDWLNDQITSFPYSYLDASQKPEKIDKKYLLKNDSIKQKAIGMLHLAYILPIILGDLFDESFENYENLICMIKIAQITAAPISDEDTPGDLQTLIAEFWPQFVILYPEAGVKPKMHYLLHLVPQIVRWGVPRLHASCARMEAKHAWFKSFKWIQFANIAKSLADKHQLYQCHMLTNTNGTLNTNFVYEGHEFGEGNLINVIILRDDIANPLRMHANRDGEIYCCKSANVNGHKYRVGCGLFLDWDSLGFTQFGKIDNMFVSSENELLFGVFIYDTLCFSNRHNAYEVSETNQYRIFHQKDLKNKWPLPIYERKTKTLIVNRYSHFVSFH